MPAPGKVQSSAGSSLADTYDVVGSVIEIERLETRHPQAVLDLQATVFSERLSGAMRRFTSGDILQSVTFGTIETMPLVPCRLLAIQMFTDNAARITRACVVVRSEFTDGTAQEIPICVWDATNSESVRFVDDNNAAAPLALLVPTLASLRDPLMTFGLEQQENAHQLVLRGDSSAFGAGTVEIWAVAYIAHAIGTGVGPSSHGLPIPSW